jgi:cell division protease FtsH
LQVCTGIERSMVGRWGMSAKIGPVSVIPQEGDPRMSGVAEQTLAAVDLEVRRLVEEAYKRALDLIRDNRERLDGIVAKLLERETLDEDEVYAAAGIPHKAELPTAAS